MDGLAGSELELAGLVGHLGGASDACGVRIGAGGTGLMAGGTGGVGGDIGVEGERLETVQGFGCLGAVVAGRGSMPGVRSGVARAVAALTGLEVIWDDGNMDLGLRDQTVVLPGHVRVLVFLWDLDIGSGGGREMQTVEVGGFGRLLGVSCTDHIACGGGGVARRGSAGHWALQGALVHYRGTQSEVVWACHKGFGTCRNSPPGCCAGRERERRIEKTIGRWHPGLDGFGTERCREESRGTRGMVNVGCQVVWCPNGPQDYGIDR